MNELWTEIPLLPLAPSLTRDLVTEVLVIGGGMAGVLCAHALREKGIDCVLVEANRLGGGITKGTTAVLTAQHDTFYTDLTARFGAEKAKQYLHANLRAVQKFRTMSQKFPCDFENMPSVSYSLTDKKQMQREAALVQALGFPAEFTTDVPLPFAVAGAVRYPDMAQFHPLKFLNAVAAQIKYYENTRVLKISGSSATTDSAKITAKKIIVATHFPFINRCGLYPAKLYQMRSFVVAYENAPQLCGTFVDSGDGGFYCRNYKDLLLIGGGDHRTGTNGGGFEAVRQFAARCFPAAREKYAWATQDCMSLDGVPYIGKYSAFTPDIYVATGFNEWGMTSSMVAADLLCDAVTGAENAFAPVFSPQRSMLQKQLFINLKNTFADFVSPTTKRCSHLGCALQWNAAEHSWDCPCHGSRFDAAGALLDNPATKDSHVN
ncbi:MAG: FAD-dependent oxidoreductase [Ruthenibacterium sp.]